ncbi:hypothetical protein F4804DRAFT_123169 [Jackrogersella minutella]|nr:hypothetical protein F4804DRAFT_123169 [Jackrogersella minutella]
MFPCLSQKCDNCGKSKDEGVTLKKCARCKSSLYCGTDCQKRDWWDSHKDVCRARTALAEGKKWYDPFRKCKDRTWHFGDLELITWGGVMSEYGEELGWGNCCASEADDLRRKYEEKFGSDDIRMYAYRPHGFRWTCCGTAGDQRFGCDHHGTGPTPCQCDFCHMGKPLPGSIYNRDTLERRGLSLPRGPDPRSFNDIQAGAARLMRPAFGMPE